MATLLSGTDDNGLFVNDETTWTLVATRQDRSSIRMRPGLFRDKLSDLALMGGNKDGQPRRRMVIVDRTVWDRPEYRAAIEGYFDYFDMVCCYVILDGHEGTKAWPAIDFLTAECLAFGIDRKVEPIIVIGGGPVADAGGTFAAWLRRHTPVIYVATTLVCMIDAMLGAKCAINYNGDKNLLGAFSLPILVIIDPSFCATQPPGGLLAALPEMGKAAMITRKRDGQLLRDLAQHGHDLIGSRFQGELGTQVIRAAVLAMLSSIAPDLYELDHEHRAADYAHTLQRGIEHHALTSGEPFAHGLAVGLCALWSNEISDMRDIIDPVTCDAYWHMLRRWGAPIWHKSLEDPETLRFALARNDDHRNGSVVLASDKAASGVIFTRVTEDEGRRAIDRLAKRANV